jgi:hypothetical protein
MAKKDEDETLNQPNQEEEEQQSPPEPETQEETSEESEAPSEEEQTEEAPEEAAETEEPPQQEEEPEEKPPSRREQLRVQQLLKKYGPPPQRQQQQTPQQAEQAKIDYRQMIDADDETIQALEQQAQQYGQGQYQQGQNQALQQVQTSEWRTLLHVDAPQVESKYGFLNPQNKEEFHPALADAINESYKNMVGFDERTGLVSNPNVRYSEFVESYMELASELAGEMNRKTTQNITRQAAQTGLRPDGSSVKRMDLNKAPEDMTDEELNAYIERAVPKK